MVTMKLCHSDDICMFIGEVEIHEAKSEAFFNDDSLAVGKTQQASKMGAWTLDGQNRKRILKR